MGSKKGRREGRQGRWKVLNMQVRDIGRGEKRGREVIGCKYKRLKRGETGT